MINVKSISCFAAAALAGFIMACTASADWIVPTSVTASSENDANSVAIHTIDGSGLSAESAAGLEAAGTATSWSFKQSNGINNNQEWITFDLGASYDLTGTYIWQFTRTVFTNEVNRGVSNFNILTSTDNITFTPLLSNVTLVKAIDISPVNGKPDGNEPAQFKALIASGVQYVKFAINSTFEGGAGKDWQGGFSEVRFEGTAVTVPEPATLALFGLGGLMMIRRRKGA